MKSPFALVTEKFGDKKKLVEAVEKFTGEELWVAKINTNKGLAHVSNAKLLRLHATFSAVKERFGTRFKLVDAIVELEKRTKDEGFRTRLLAYPVPRLWDMFRSAQKRHGIAEPKAEQAKGAPAKAPKPSASKPNVEAKPAKAPAKKAVAAKSSGTAAASAKPTSTSAKPAEKPAKKTSTK